jgi:hypothetical protein
VSAKSKDLCSDICQATRDLLTAGARPRAGCSDNCRNVVKAIAQVVIALGSEDLLRLLQLSCAIHTELLTLVDLRKMHPTAAAYVSWLADVMRWLHSARVKMVLKNEVHDKMPLVQESKWSTLFKASRFVHEHYEFIAPLLEKHNRELYDRVKTEFDAVHVALMPLLDFIERAEADNVTQQRAFVLKRDLQLQWQALRPNPYAAALEKLTNERFVSTGDGARCEAAYWLTPAGHAENAQYLQYVKWAKPAVPVDLRARVTEFCGAHLRVKAKIVEDARIILPTAAIELGAAEAMGIQFDRYLEDANAWPKGSSEFDVWPHRRWTGATDAAQQVASVAEVLTQLPASEAAAERLFSVFVALFNDRRLRANRDIVEAEMIIRMWQIYYPNELCLPLDRCTRP